MRQLYGPQLVRARPDQGGIPDPVEAGPRAVTVTS